MKRIGYLYDKLLDKDFIRTCIIESSKGKKKRKQVKYVLEYIETSVDIIYNMVINNDIKLGKTHSRYIKEYTKTREITISPYFPNQVLDYMLVKSIQPLLKRMFYRYSVGNVNGKGIKYGKEYLEKRIKYYKYFVKLDIHHFYQSVNTKKLFDLIAKRIKDKKYLDFVWVIISRFDYLPIGTYYSQWLSNFYITELDYFIKQSLKIETYVRYVDDMVLLSNDKSYLQKCAYLIRDELKKYDLKLKYIGIVKSTKTPISFIGFRFYKNSANIRQPLLERIKRTIKKIEFHLSIHLVRRMLSLTGWLKQIKNGYIFYKNNIYNIIKLGKLRRYVSYASNQS